MRVPTDYAPSVAPQVGGPVALPFQRIDASPAAFGAGIGEANIHSGAASAASADRSFATQMALQGLQDETRAKDAATGFSRDLSDLQFNPKTGFQTKLGRDAIDSYPDIQTKVDALHKQYRDGLPNPEAQRMFDASALREAQRSVESMSSHVAQQNRVWMQQSSDARIANMNDIASLNYNDDYRFGQAVATIKDEVQQQGEMNGWAPEQVQAAQSKAVSTAWYQRLTAMDVHDPNGARTLYGRVSDQLDPAHRAAIDQKILGRQQLAVRAAQAADTHAEHMLRLRGEAAEKDMFQLDADHGLTRDWLDANKRWLPPAGYKAGLELVDPRRDVKDDSATVAYLVPRLDDANLDRELTNALLTGHISKPTYISLSEKNRAHLRDDQPASPYKSGFSLVKTTLDPGQLVTGAAAAIGRAGMAQALLEYENNAAAHPGATREELQGQAQQIIKRYQIISFNDMSMATGLPKYYSGTRDSMTLDDVGAAEAKTLEALDTKKLSSAQADQELRTLNNWRGILQAKAAAAAVPATPAPRAK